MNLLRPVLFFLILPVTAISQTPKQVETELLLHFTRLEQASNYGGSSNSDIQDAENKAIRATFLKYGRRSDILSYSFPRLGDKMNIVTSQDRRLRTYSWDDEGGGTMHNFYTAYQYLGRSGKVYTDKFITYKFNGKEFAKLKQ